jgi:hypothetical protein|tara:strand:- start:222 stop:800 length:579 start_codon:yes stop_codon:yes gene_type:complete
MVEAKTPTIKWAQRKDCLFVTIELLEVKNPIIEITDDNKLKFNGSSDGINYSLEMELFEKVNREESKWTIATRNIFLNIKKSEKGPHWAYINKDKIKHNYIKFDWNNFIDEDEEDVEENPQGGMGGGFPGMGGMGGGNNFMDMANMGGLGGMGGMPDMGDMGDMGEGLDEDDVNPEDTKEGDLDDLDKPAEN